MWLDFTINFAKEYRSNVCLAWQVLACVKQPLARVGRVGRHFTTLNTQVDRL